MSSGATRKRPVSVRPPSRSRVRMKLGAGLLAVCLFATACAAPHRMRRQLSKIQKHLIETYHPKPVLDTITPEEKRTKNTMTHPIGEVVVRTVQALSDTIDSITQFGDRRIKLLPESVIASLDRVGGRLVGLQD